MNIPSRIAVGFLLALTILVLVINVRSLYTTPVANTWVWWSGDETQSMVEERSLLETGLYTYRYMNDNTVAHGSGILKGSVWLVSLLYAGPTLLTDVNFVWVGRTVNALLGLLLLALVYWASRRFGARPVIALGGVFLLASSTCYFVMSHTARPDIPVGIANLLLLAGVAIAGGNPRSVARTRDHLYAAGAVFGAALLVSLHVPIDCTIPVLFILWRAKILRNITDFLRFVAGFLMIFVPLTAIYLAASGAFSLLGFFSPDSAMLPINSIFRGRSDLSNIVLRYFFAREWIPYYLTAGIVVGALLLITTGSRPKRAGFRLTNAQRLWLEALPLFVLSTVILEARLPRYLIFVLPVFTVTLAFLTEGIWSMLRAPRWRMGLAVSSGVLFVIITWQSTQTFRSMEAVGNQITANNASVSKQVYAAILNDSRRTSGSENPGKLKTMLSTPALLNLATMAHIDPYTAFFNYPDTARALALHNLRVRGIQYIVKTTSSLIRDTYEDDEPLEGISPSALTPIFQTCAIVSDIGRNYSPDMCIGTDTIRVYAVR